MVFSIVQAHTNTRYLRFRLEISISKARIRLDESHQRILPIHPPETSNGNTQGTMHPSNEAPGARTQHMEVPGAILRHEPGNASFLIPIEGANESNCQVVTIHDKNWEVKTTSLIVDRSDGERINELQRDNFHESMRTSHQRIAKLPEESDWIENVPRVRSRDRVAPQADEKIRMVRQVLQQVKAEEPTSPPNETGAAAMVEFA